MTDPVPIVTHRHNGCLGIDMNATHLSYCLSKADGNYLGHGIHHQHQEAVLVRRTESEEKDFFTWDPAFKPTIKGDRPLDWVDQPQSKSLSEARKAAFELVKLALWHQVPIGMECLDFSEKKRKLRYENPKYAHMLSGFAYRSLTTAIQSCAAQHGVEVILVDPAYTSKMGFIKYGHTLGLSVDQGAAFAIARKAILSTPWFAIDAALPDEEKKALSAQRQSIKKKVNGEWVILAKRAEKLPKEALAAALLFTLLNSNALIRKNAALKSMGADILNRAPAQQIIRDDPDLECEEGLRSKPELAKAGLSWMSSRLGSKRGRWQVQLKEAFQPLRMVWRNKNENCLRPLMARAIEGLAASTCSFEETASSPDQPASELHSKG